MWTSFVWWFCLLCEKQAMATHGHFFATGLKFLWFLRIPCSGRKVSGQVDDHFLTSKRSFSALCEHFGNYQNTLGQKKKKKKHFSGSFHIGKYWYRVVVCCWKLTYVIDGSTIKTIQVEYGTKQWNSLRLHLRCWDWHTDTRFSRTSNNKNHQQKQTSLASVWLNDKHTYMSFSMRMKSSMVTGIGWSWFLNHQYGQWWLYLVASHDSCRILGAACFVEPTSLWCLRGASQPDCSQHRHVFASHFGKRKTAIAQQVSTAKTKLQNINRNSMKLQQSPEKKKK